MQSFHSFALLCAATLLIGACAGTKDDGPSSPDSDTESSESAQTSQGNTGNTYKVLGWVGVEAVTKPEAKLQAQETCNTTYPGYTYYKANCAGLEWKGHFWAGLCQCQGRN